MLSIEQDMSSSKATEKKQSSGTSLFCFVVESKRLQGLSGPLVEIPKTKTYLETLTFIDQSRR